MTLVTCSGCMCAFNPGSKPKHALEIEFPIHLCPSCSCIADNRYPVWREKLFKLFMHGELPRVS